MNEVFINLALAIFGLAMGSFAGATVWRLRAKQLAADRKLGEEYDKAEYASLKKLLGKPTLKDRSQCLHCGYELKWYDLIPLVSWLSLGGKCRSCKHSIGYLEPIIEVSVAIFFVASFLFWPYDLSTGLQIAHLVLWLVAGVIMAVLFAYDYKWYLLPLNYIIALVAVGLAVVVVSAITSGELVATILSALASVVVLGGLYAALHFGSRGRWVGGGDAQLGLGLGLLLVDWKLSLVALFMANFIGTLIVLPLLIAKKLKRTTRVPFGPLMIAGAIVALLFGQYIIDWYLSGLGLY